MVSIVVCMFFVISIVFTIKYRFIQLKMFKETRKTLLKDKKRSTYKTFLVLLASHIGTGNVVGITSAIIVGGAGSLFWMWIFALFGSVYSIIENTIGQVYKKTIDGEIRGGSPFYIKYGLNKPTIAIIIAIFLVLTNTIFFQPLQVNTISESLFLAFNIPYIISFLVLAFFCIFIVFKGTKKIIRFCEIIVPIMSIGYITLGLSIIIMHYNNFFNVIKIIFNDAFNVDSIIGGCIFVGFKKSLFSNEAGLGTAPTISVLAEVDMPIKQGFISAFGVFFDTIVICSITGFMILMNNISIDVSMYSGCDLIFTIFKMIFGNIGGFLATFFMITFALATVVSQYYLGETNLLFIIENMNHQKQKLFRALFQIIFIIGIYIGVFFNITNIWRFVDTGMLLLGIINIYAIIKLRKIFDNNLAIYRLDKKK